MTSVGGTGRSQSLAAWRELFAVARGVAADWAAETYELGHALKVARRHVPPLERGDVANQALNAFVEQARLYRDAGPERRRLMADWLRAGATALEAIIDAEDARTACAARRAAGPEE